jgi:hypothetical protein
MIMNGYRSLAIKLLSLRTMLGIFLLLILVYATLLYPWVTNWGATTAEQKMELPGDALHPNADIQVTRAISIDAPPEEVWPWVIQVGQDRAGFYSYDWLENLFTADIHSADRLVPEWQDSRVGDIVPLARLDYLGGRIEASRPEIALIEPNRSFVVTGFASFELLPSEGNTTRLLVRDWQGAANAPLIQRAALRAYNFAFWDPAHFVMQRQMMRGIKARAEGNSDPPAVLQTIARIGWIAAAAALAGLFLSGSRKGWVLLPLALVPPILLTTGDIDAALAGFLAFGITVLGALRFGRRWWPPFSLLAAAILLVLLLAQDAFVAFGLVFLSISIVTLAAVVYGWLGPQLTVRQRAPSVP